MVPKISRGLSLPARFLLGIIVTRMNGENEAWPSQDSIALELGCSKRSVVTYIQELETAHFIMKKRSGRGLSNVYTLSPENDFRSANSALLDMTNSAPLEVQSLHIPHDRQESLKRTKNSKRGLRTVDIPAERKKLISKLSM